MSTRSKRTSDVMKAELDIKSEDGSELEELNEEEYERERLENIKNNAALLDSLGLSSKPSIRPREPTKIERGATETRLKKENGVKRRRVVVEPTRRSGRMRAMEEDEKEGKKRKYTEDEPIDEPIRGPALPKQKAIIIPGPLYDEDEDEVTEAPLPIRDADGRLRFEGRWEGVFTPNVTPQEMFEGGAFGGGFFVSTHSQILRTPLPSGPSLATLPFTPTPSILPTHYTSSEPTGEVNRFKVRAGQSLQEWEKAGWIWSGDPRGWAEWYCRFWGGRRCGDDERQVRRWLKVAGPTGRFKRSLLKKMTLNGGISALEDEEIGAVLRQCLWQWGYEVTRPEYDRAMRGDE